MEGNSLSNCDENKIAEVPTIDIGPLFTSNFEEKLKVAKEIKEICRFGCGFFYIKNHNISQETLDLLVSKCQDLHKRMSDEEKYEIAIFAYNKVNIKQKRNGYYLPIKGKKAVESYDYLNPNFDSNHPMIIKGIPLHEVNVWPNEEKFSGLRQFLEEYYFKMFALAEAILSGLALAIGKEENFFKPYFTKEDTLSCQRLIRYPYLEEYPPRLIAEDGTELNFGSHVDVSLISIGYLPFCDPIQVEFNGKYYDIPGSDDPLLVNIGGFFELLTKGYFKSPVHRVKWFNIERLSLPFFVNLSYNSEIKPFWPEDFEETNEPSLKYGEYLENGINNLIKTNGQT